MGLPRRDASLSGSNNSGVTLWLPVGGWPVRFPPAFIVLVLKLSLIGELLIWSFAVKSAFALVAGFIEVFLELA